MSRPSFLRPAPTTSSSASASASASRPSGTGNGDMRPSIDVIDLTAEDDSPSISPATITTTTTTTNTFPRRRSSHTIGRRLSNESDDVILLPNQTRQQVRNRASRPPRFGRDIINPVDYEVVDLASSTQSPQDQRQQQHQNGSGGSAPSRPSGPSLTPLPFSSDVVDMTSGYGLYPMTTGNAWRRPYSRFHGPSRYMSDSPAQPLSQSRTSARPPTPEYTAPQRERERTSASASASTGTAQAQNRDRRASSPEVTFISENVREDRNPAASSAFIRQVFESIRHREVLERVLRRQEARRALYRSTRDPSHLRSEIQRTTRVINRTLPSTFSPYWGDVIDYDSYGEGHDTEGPFLLGGTEFVPRPLPERPAYRAPEAAPEGFTRKVSEDQVVVCPNCDHELGKDGDEEESNQVWVVKQCGHVYCGFCTVNRKKSARQANVKSKPFSKCVVEGCGRSVSSSTAMLQIYL